MKQAEIDRRRKIIVSAAAACVCGLAAAGFWIHVRAASRRAEISLPSSFHLDAAIAADEAALKENPDDLKALTNLGLRYYLKGPGSYAEAINDLEDARNMGALDARIFYCLGIMYQNLGLYPFALENYERYLRNRPDDKKIALLDAKLLYQSGRFAEAAAAYKRLEPRDPDNPVLAENLALSLWKNKDPQGALSELSRMSAFGPAAAERAAFDAARIDFEAKHFNDALDELAKAQSGLGPNADNVAPLDFYRLLAKASQKSNQPEKALAAWNQVLALNPKDREAARAARLLKRRIPARAGRLKAGRRGLKG